MPFNFSGAKGRGLFELLRYGVEKGEEFGGEFVEARFDNLVVKEITLERKLIREIKTAKRVGIGINAYYQGSAGYSFTTNLTREGVTEAALKAVKIAKSLSLISKMKVKPEEAISPTQKSEKKGLTIRDHPKDFSLDYKKNLVSRAIESAEEHGEKISSITGSYGELYGEKFFTNSNKVEVSWSPIVVGLRIQVFSKNGGLLVEGRDTFGGSVGFEAFTGEHSPEAIGKNAAEWAAEKLKGKSVPPGKYRALLENSLVGVLIHESFGHLAEADGIISKSSPLTGRLGEQLGCESATVIDEGTPDIKKYGGVWIPFDDQGVETVKVAIMENGKLLNYLHSRETASLMNTYLTGNARALNYNFPPIPRMRNTYLAPGDLSLEEALEQLNTGIYAIGGGGGHGGETFVFKALRGYYIEKGEKKYPLHEVMLSGNIFTILKNIEGMTKELVIYSNYFGGCGKGEQIFLPVGDGGPHVLLSEVIFGGEL